MRYFASRNAMDIEGLGDKLVDQLVATGMVAGYGDLYRLDAEKLVELERMGRKSSEESAGRPSRPASRAAWLDCSMPCRFATSARGWPRVLAEHFQSIEALEKATVDELSEHHWRSAR